MTLPIAARSPSPSRYSTFSVHRTAHIVKRSRIEFWRTPNAAGWAAELACWARTRRDRRPSCEPAHGPETVLRDPDHDRLRNVRCEYLEGGIVDNRELLSKNATVQTTSLEDLFFDYKVREKLPKLREKFTDQEIMYGLRSLLGQAGGKNDTYQWDREGLVVLKYRATSDYNLQVRGAETRQMAIVNQSAPQGPKHHRRPSRPGVASRVWPLSRLSGATPTKAAISLCDRLLRVPAD
jgi:hypothetical protein